MGYEQQLRAAGVLLLLLFACASILVVGFTMTASAQSSDLIPNQSELLQEADKNPDVYAHAITDDVRIVDYNYNEEGKLTMVVESDKRVKGRITDASRPITGTIDIPRKDVSLVDGRTEVTFQVVNSDNAAVTFATDGRLTGVGEQGASIFRGPATWDYVRAGSAAGLVGGLIPVGYAAIRKRREDKEEVNRVL